MLGTYNVVIYHHSVMVLGEQLESKFPKHTGNKVMWPMLGFVVVLICCWLVFFFFTYS